MKLFCLFITTKFRDSSEMRSCMQLSVHILSQRNDTKCIGGKIEEEQNTHSDSEDFR
jgi:hypothetical protein